MRSLCVLLILTALWPAAAAAVPMTVTYSGRLLDDQGEPLQGDWTLGVALFHDLDDPTELSGFTAWEDTFETIVDNGWFSVILGSHVDRPLTADHLDAEQVYVALSLDGGPWMAPASELTASPFAVRASLAEEADFAQVAADVEGGTVRTQELYIDGFGADPVISAAGVWQGAIDTDRSADVRSLRVNGQEVINANQQWVGTNALDLPTGSTLDGEPIVTGASYNDADVLDVIGPQGVDNPRNHPRYTPEDLLVDIGVVASPTLVDETMKGQLHWTPAEIIAVGDAYYLRIDNPTLEGLTLNETLHLVGDDGLPQPADIRFYTGGSSDTPANAAYRLSALNGAFTLSRPIASDAPIMKVTGNTNVLFYLQDQAFELSIDNTWGAIATVYGKDSGGTLGTVARIASDGITFRPGTVTQLSVDASSVVLRPSVTTGRTALEATDDEVALFAGGGVTDVPLRVRRNPGQVQLFADDGSASTASAILTNITDWNGLVGTRGVGFAGNLQVAGELEATGEARVDDLAVGGDLGVVGTISGPTVTATGAVQGATVTATGALNGASAAIGGNATVTGTATVGGLTVGTVSQTSCPSGMTRLGVWCIETSSRFPTTYFAAAAACGDAKRELCPLSVLVHCDQANLEDTFSGILCDDTGAGWENSTLYGYYDSDNNTQDAPPLNPSTFILPYQCCMRLLTPP